MARLGRSIPNKPTIKRPCINRAPFRYGLSLRPLAATWNKRFPIFRALFGRAKMPFSRRTCGNVIVRSLYSGEASVTPEYAGSASTTPAYSGMVEFGCCEC